jgi:hypothetical protein
MRPLLLSPAFLVFSMIAVALEAPRAVACSPDVLLSRELTGRTLPSTGATGVPTNARLFFASTDGLTAGVNATLRRGSNEPVAVTVEAVAGGFVLHGFVLEPDSAYSATIDLAVSEDADDPLPDDALLSAILDFTTGSAADTTAPTWQGDADVAVQHFPGDGPLSQLFPSMCGREPTFDEHTITPPAPSEAVAAVELSLVLPDGNRQFLDSGPPGEPLFHNTYDAGVVSYELVAVDIAGNRTEALAFEAPGVSGCSAVGSGDHGTQLAMLGGLLLVRRRRSVAARSRT